MSLQQGLDGVDVARVQRRTVGVLGGGVALAGLGVTEIGRAHV